MTRLSGFEAEELMLRQITPALESEGYEVIRHPPRSMLPKFMNDYLPDAIALGKNKNIAIEIKSRNIRSDLEKIQSIKKIFDGKNDWEFRIFVLDENQYRATIPLSDYQVIYQSIQNLKSLVSDKQSQAALLMAWSVFESIGRVLLKGRFLYPQPPINLIAALAEEGYLVPEDADFLRNIWSIRNMLAHGQLHVAPEQEDLLRFINILTEIVTFFDG